MRRSFKHKRMASTIRQIIIHTEMGTLANLFSQLCGGLPQRAQRAGRTLNAAAVSMLTARYRRGRRQGGCEVQGTGEALVLSVYEITFHTHHILILKTVEALGRSHVPVLV